MMSCAPNRSHAIAVLLAAAALTGGAGAQPAPLGNTLVKDIRPGPIGTPLGSSPARVGLAGGFSVFSASASGVGREPMATDGTSAGTIALGDLAPGISDSMQAGIGNRGALAGGVLVFTARSSLAVGYELWRTDGTAAGTALVEDLAPGSASSEPFGHVSYQGSAYFLAQLQSELHLMRSDGTAAGTFSLASLPSLVGGPVNWPGFVELFVAGARLWVWTGSANGDKLIACDGTAAGTAVVATLPGAAFLAAGGQGVGVGSRVLFSTTSALSTTVWSTDGTPGGSLALATAPSSSGFSSLAWLVQVPGKALFAFHGTGGSPPSAPLYASDGTPAGTQLVTALLAVESALAGAGGVVFFATSDAAHGREPHFTDGTAAGTFELMDVAPGSASSAPAALGAHAGLVFFTATEPAGGRELYATDGTPSGTAQVADLAPGAASTTFGDALAACATPNGLVFTAGGPAGSEPWVTDGTGAGTHLLADLAPNAAASSDIALAVRFGDRLAFVADDGVHGRELWTSDGTAAGTALLVDLVPGAAGADPTQLVVLGNRLLFDARSPASAADREPWISDGTAAGTHLLKDVNSTPHPGGGTNPSLPEQFTVAGGLAYFVAHDGVHGFELWRTDGTEAGTALTRDLYQEPAPGSATLRPTVVGAAGARAFMLWREQALGGGFGSGREICVSDGTAAGTELVIDLAPGAADAPIFEARTVADRLLFAFTGAATGTELWRCDGTAGGTALVADLSPGGAASNPRYFAVHGERLLFIANAAGGPGDLWSSDGSAAGTAALNLQSQVGQSVVPVWQAEGALAFFRFADTSGAQRLFRTDGTAPGTFEVLSFSATPNPFVPNAPSAFATAGAAGHVAFGRATPGSGVELWVAAGAPQAAFQLTETNPGSADALPALVVRAGNDLFFVANDGGTGRELHAVPFAATGAFDVAPYGPACAAAAPPPALDASGTPALGQSAALLLEGAEPGAATLLFWSAAKGAIPLPGGCALLLGSPALVLAAPASPAGGLTLPFTVPNLPGLAGFVANFQLAAAAPGGPYLGSYEFTAGLELVLGP